MIDVIREDPTERAIKDAKTVKEIAEAVRPCGGPARVSLDTLAIVNALRVIDDRMRAIASGGSDGRRTIYVEKLDGSGAESLRALFSAEAESLQAT